MSDEEDVNLSEESESDFSASESEYNPESDVSVDSEQEASEAESTQEDSEGSDDERDESFNNKTKKRPPPKRGQKTRKLSLSSSFRDKTVNAYRNAAKKFTSNPNVSNNLKDILLRAQLKNKKKLSSSQTRQSSNEGDNDPPNFDCSAGVQLSDSESEDESSSNQITVPKQTVTNLEQKKKSNPIINSINEASGSSINMSKILQNLQEVEKTTEQLKNMQTKANNSEKDIDNMNISQLLALGESSTKTSKRAHTQVESDDSDEWEEVEATAEKSKVPIRGIEITITSGKDRKEKAKKEIDEDLCMRRQFNRQRKEHQVFLHKVNLICWIGHGNFVSPILNNTSLMAQCLAMLPKNNNHCYPKEKTNTKYFQQITEFFRREIKLNNRDMYCKITKRPHLMQSLALQIKTKMAICRRDFILIYIILLRAIGIQCRMVQSLNMAPMKPPQSELLSLSTKNNKKEKKEKNDEEDGGSITKYSTYSSCKSSKSSSKAGSSGNSKKSTKSKKSAELSDVSENIDEDEEMAEVAVKRPSRSRAKVAKISEPVKKSTRSTKKSTDIEDKENLKKSGKLEASTVSTRTRSHRNEERTPLLPQFDGADDVPKKSLKPLKIKALKGFEVSMSQSFVNLSGEDSPRASTSRTKKIEKKNLEVSPKKLRSRSNSTNQNSVKDTRNANSSKSKSDEAKSPQRVVKQETEIKLEDQSKEPEKKKKKSLHEDQASTSQEKKPNLSNLKKSLNNSAEKVSKTSQKAEKTKDLKKRTVSGKSNDSDKSDNKKKSQEIENSKGTEKSENVKKTTRSSKEPALLKKTDESEKQEKDHMTVNAPSPRSTDTKKKSPSKPNLSKLKETQEKPKETVKPKTATKRRANDDNEAGPSDPKKSKIAAKKRVSFHEDSKNSKKSKTSKSDDESFAEESGQESEDDSLKYFNLKKVKPGSIAPKSVVSKLKARDRRILSTDLDESVLDRDDEITKKSGIDIWVELYSEEEEKWIPVDVFKGKVNCVPEICKAATHPITYVFAWNNDNSIKDVSPRYCPNFNTTTRKLRVEREYLDSILKMFIGRPSNRDKKEDAEFTQIQFDKPLPTKISDFKNHPLYALKRHLLKFEAIYPPDAPTVGFIREEPIYPRDCVFTLHSREVWVKQARVVRAFEEPYKIVMARPKWDRATNSMKTDIPLEIFGIWQTDEYEPPTAENGIVPRNAYGNVELFKACMLPKKTVHLQLPSLHRVCKKLNVDCAQAVVGFDFHGGSSHPVFDGYVICEEFAEKVVDAWNRDQDEMEQREQDKIEKRVYGNWKKLIKGLLIRERLNLKYNFKI